MNSTQNSKGPELLAQNSKNSCVWRSWQKGAKREKRVKNKRLEWVFFSRLESVFSHSQLHCFCSAANCGCCSCFGDATIRRTICAPIMAEYACQMSLSRCNIEINIFEINIWKRAIKKKTQYLLLATLSGFKLINIVQVLCFSIIFLQSQWFKHSLLAILITRP